VQEEERNLIEDLKRHTQLTVAWSRHGSLVPRGTAATGRSCVLHCSLFTSLYLLLSERMLTLLP